MKKNAEESKVKKENTIKSTNTKTKKEKTVSKSSTNKSKKIAPSKEKKENTSKIATNVRNKKTTTKKSTSKISTRKQNNVTLEYYDLPYRYNETIVKILAQTPTTLFVYWDIADSDKQKYIENFGQNFFDNSKPILIVHNVTHNQTYEIEINDFANCWYLTTNEPNCNYEISLGRKFINTSSNNDDIIFVTSSNTLETPNDHILLENIFSNSPVTFKNIKTGTLSYSSYGSISFLPQLSKFYSINDFYTKFYKEDLFVVNKQRIIKNMTSS